MPFEDKTLKCVECGAAFVFTAADQEFFQEKGYRNEPKRCPTCREKRRSQGRGSGGRNMGYRERPKVEITCATCGQKAFVSFKPGLDKPVYCDACFAKRQAARWETYGGET